MWRETPYFVFGAQKRADKCAIACGRGLGGMREIAIVQLDDESNHSIGDKNIKSDEMEKVLCHLCFAHKKSLEVLIEAAQSLLENWEGETT